MSEPANGVISLEVVQPLELKRFVGIRQSDRKADEVSQHLQG